MAKTIPLVLLYKDWPQADIAAWESLFTTGDIFDGVGPCADWSAGSQKKRRQSYGYWLSWCLRHQPVLLGQPPTTRISKEAVRGFLDEASARVNSVTLKCMISDLYVIARAMAPTGDWDWLNRLFKRLQHQSDRKSLPAPVPLSAGEVLAKSLAWLENAGANSSASDLKRAIHFRSALMIAFLISRPVRRRALLAMTTSKHLQRTTSGFNIRFSPEDMKDGRGRWFSLPDLLVQPMQSYLEAHRPVLLGAGSTDALWVNQYGKGLTADGLSRELPRVTKQLLGIELRPHKFRHIAATSIAEQDPEHVNIIKDLLGHATLEMSHKHYNRATGLSACSDYQALLRSKLNALQNQRSATKTNRKKA